jgi:hypothetical protein
VEEGIAMVYQSNPRKRDVRDYSFWLRMVMVMSGIFLVGSLLLIQASSTQAAATHMQPNAARHSIKTHVYPALTHPYASIDAAIRLTTASSWHRIGSTVTYAAVVATSAASLALTESTPINVSVLLPIGLIDVTVDGGSTWAINSTATTSPSIITASYIDTYPIAPGSTLPPVTITGIVGTSDSATYSATASLFIPGNDNSADDSSICTFTVSSPMSLPGTIDAAISITSPHTSYAIGETAWYTVEVATTDASSICSADTPLNITILFPLGLTDIIAASNSSWSINISAETSPSIITASYIGPYPILPGTMLPPVTIVGIVDATANATYVSTANLTVPGDLDSANNFSIDTFTVALPSGNTKNPLNAPIKAPTLLASRPAITMQPASWHDASASD